MKSFNLGDKAPGSNEGDRQKDRRQSGGTHEGSDRRTGVDRRGLKVGLRFKSSRALGPLEDWLEEHYPGEFRLTIEDISEDLYVKDVRVVFSNEEQRANFKVFLSSYLKTGGFS